MLQLAGGVGLGVDVGNLLELERAFERDRVARAAAEIEHVARLGEGLATEVAGGDDGLDLREELLDFGDELFGVLASRLELVAALALAALPLLITFSL